MNARRSTAHGSLGFLRAARWSHCIMFSEAGMYSKPPGGDGPWRRTDQWSDLVDIHSKRKTDPLLQDEVTELMRDVSLVTHKRLRVSSEVNGGLTETLSNVADSATLVSNSHEDQLTSSIPESTKLCGGSYEDPMLRVVAMEDAEVEEEPMENASVNRALVLYKEPSLPPFPLPPPPDAPTIVAPSAAAATPYPLADPSFLQSGGSLSLKVAPIAQGALLQPPGEHGLMKALDLQGAPFGSFRQATGIQKKLQRYSSCSALLSVSENEAVEQDDDMDEDVPMTVEDTSPAPQSNLNALIPWSPSTMGMNSTKLSPQSVIEIISDGHRSSFHPKVDSLD